MFNRDKKQTSQKDVKQKQGKAGWNKKYSKNALENEEWNVSLSLSLSFFAWQAVLIEDF